MKGLTLPRVEMKAQATFLIGLLAIAVSACTLDADSIVSDSNKMQGEMDAAIHLFPGVIDVTNKNDFPWYGLITTLNTHDGRYSTRYNFGDANWHWLRPDNVQEPGEMDSPSLVGDTAFMDRDGNVFDGNRREEGRYTTNIREVSLEAKSIVDGPYDLAFTIAFADAQATPTEVRRKSIRIYIDTKSGPGLVYDSIWLEHHEPAYEEVIAFLSDYPQGVFGSYPLPATAYREVQVMLGLAPIP